MNKYLDTFRMNMKYYREQAGISQIYLSVLCDCGTGTIGGIESGKAKPSFDMMVRIAEALKVNPADFFIRDASRSKAELKATLKENFDTILSNF
ncbi:MAG: helix-turn-helix transcriptional regulator [Treponema sp.]|nr:helix-turn-helix transcriptional regulator [Treponema sp.]